MIAFHVRDLKAVLSKMRSVVERRNAIPILSCVHIDMGGDMARITATDLDIVVTCDVPSTGAINPVCVPFMGLLNLIWCLPGDGMVKLHVKDDRLIVDMADGRASLMTLAAADYPMDAVTLGQPNRIGFDVQVAPLLDCLPCVSEQESRYYLCGVYLHRIDGKILAVATDGHKIAVLPAGEAQGPDFGGIIPTKTVKAIKSFMPKDAVLDAVFADAKASFAAPGVTIRAKLIDGTYPNYARVIPKPDTATATWTFSQSALLAKVQRFRQFRSGVNNGMFIKADAARVTGQFRSIGYGDVALALPGEASAAFALSCNARYLADVLGVIGPGDVTCRIIDPGSPLTFEKDGRIAVLMPMRGYDRFEVTVPEGALP